MTCQTRNMTAATEGAPGEPDWGSLHWGCGPPTGKVDRPPQEDCGRWAGAGLNCRGATGLGHGVLPIRGVPILYLRELRTVTVLPG